MSKCDLEILFDRPTRTYRGGEEVAGTVRVHVRRAIDSGGVLWEHFWQTHGRGNTATGPKQTSTLFQGQLEAGQSLSYPFRFTAPCGPPTYHGRYLNVDHYVRVQVDVPWAIDPKLQEEYVLLPGDRPYGDLPTPGGGAAFAKPNALKLGVPLAAVMLIAGVFYLFPCGLFLIPAGLAILFYSLRKSLAEKKIGQVALHWGPLIVSPGEGVPLRLSFTPRRPSRLNRISATLAGMERCVSGSGTNKSTHTHKFYDQAFLLAPAGEVRAFEPIRIERAIPIPQTNAFSFSAKDNQLLWELEVRIDIPLWPDWVEKRTVIVRPAVEPQLVEAKLVETRGPAVPALGAPLAHVPGAGGFAEGRGQVQVGTSAFDEPPSEQPPAEPSFAEEAPDVAGQASEPEFPAAGGQTPAGAMQTDEALLAVIDRLGSTSRYSRQREEIIQEQAERPFQCSLEIAKVERTYAYVPDKRFRGGRTVTGVIAGTDHKVSLQTTEARNAELDALRPGEVLQVRCKLVKWNTIYDRLETRETADR